MITIYRVTLNGSPVLSTVPGTLQAAAYTAACLATSAPSDRRGDRKTCVFDVEPVDVVCKLTRAQRDADRLAMALAFSDSTDARLLTLAVGLMDVHENEAEELSVAGWHVETLVPVA
jgi:hypothetical protein